MKRSERRLVPYKFQSGLDSGRDPKATGGGPIVLENYEFVYRDSITPRIGRETLDTTSNSVLAALGDKILTIGDQGVELYSRLTDQLEKVADAPPFFDVETFDIDPHPMWSTVSPSIAISGDAILVAYFHWSALIAKTFYKPTMQLVSDVVLADGYAQQTANARAITDDDGNLLLFYSTVAGALKYRVVDAETCELSNEQTPPGDPYDVDVTVCQKIEACIAYDPVNGTRVVLAYSGEDAESVCLYSFAYDSSTPVGVAAQVHHPIDGVRDVTCWKMGNSVAVAYAFFAHGDPIGQYEVRALAVNIVLTEVTVTEVTLLETGVEYIYWHMTGICEPGGSSRSQVYFSNLLGDSQVFSIAFEDDSGTGVAGTQTLVSPNSALWSKPFIRGVGELARTCMWLHFEQGTQRTLFLVTAREGSSIGAPSVGDAVPPIAIARALVDVAGGYESFKVRKFVGLADCIIDNGDIYVLAAKKVDDKATSLAITRTSMAAPRCLEAARTLLVASSIPYEFDGRQLTEHGHMVFAEKITATATEDDYGRTLAPGTYSFAVVLLKTNAAGDIIRSAPSELATVVVGAGHKSVEVKVFLPLFMRDWDVFVDLYRTEVNGPASEMFAVSRKHLQQQFDEDLYYLEFISDEPDEDIIENERIYVSGGELENIMSPPVSVQCLFQERHFVVDADRPATRIRYSKGYVDGRGYQHTDYFRIDVPFVGGKITALCPMDDKLLIFKERAVYATYGAGHSVVGGERNYAAPQLVTNLYGCTGWKTTCAIPAGVMFDSASGICLITRDLQATTLMGDPILQHYLGEGGVESAINAVDRESVYYLGPDRTTSMGDRQEGFVYDYKRGVWATFTKLAGSSAICVGGKVFHLSRASAGVRSLIEHTGADDDGGSIETAIDTGFISPFGPMGWGRVVEAYIVGYRPAAEEISVQVAYDFSPGWHDVGAQFNIDNTKHWPTTITDYYGGGGVAGAAAYVVRLTMPRQKCSSIRLKIDRAQYISHIVFVAYPMGPARHGHEDYPGEGGGGAPPLSG